MGSTWSEETYRDALAHTGGTPTTAAQRGRRGGEAAGADGPRWTPPWPRADPSDPFFSLMAQHKIVSEFHEQHGAMDRPGQSVEHDVAFDFD